MNVYEILFLILGGFLTTRISANIGPQVAYQRLSSQVFYLSDSGGTQLEIKPYNEIKQIGVSNISLGLFQTYVDNSNIYTYQSYTGGSNTNGCTPRSFDLTLGCSATTYLGTVTESPPCNYYADLFTPLACGIDYNVGQELASASTTPTPTPSISYSSSQTPSISLSSTPLYFVTLFPSASQTMTSSPSTTPLFMVSAWPTTSPVNVSATSTPLYFLTPYPSYNPNNGSAIGFLTGQTGTTGLIMGAVAVAMVGGGAIFFVIKHFRSGGTIGGLASIVIKNKDKIMKTVDGLPVPDSVKSMAHKADNLVTKNAKNISDTVNKTLDDSILPEDLKRSVKKIVPKSADELAQIAEDPTKHLQSAKTQLKEGAQASFKKTMIDQNSIIPDEYKKTLSDAFDKQVEKMKSSKNVVIDESENKVITNENDADTTVDVDTPLKPTSLADLHLSIEDLELVQKTLAEKAKLKDTQSAVDL